MEKPKVIVVDRYSYEPPVIIMDCLSKSMTIPDQSLTIEEILDKHTRGIPVNVTQFEPVYFDDENYDLEKIARSDFAEKFDLQAMEAERARRMQDELEADQDEEDELVEDDKDEVQPAASTQKKRAAGKTGKGALDNTLPVDTTPDAQ